MPESRGEDMNKTDKDNDNLQQKDVYEDIIKMRNHVSKSRPHMSASDRAAQFAPFAALNGFEEAVKDTAKRNQVYWENVNKI